MANRVGTKKVSARDVGNWTCNVSVDVLEDGSQTCDTQTLILCTLQMIREELRAIHATMRTADRKLSALECPNFTAVPRILRRISSNTAKPKKAKRPKLRAVA